MPKRTKRKNISSKRKYPKKKYSKRRSKRKYSSFRRSYKMKGGTRMAELRRRAQAQAATAIEKGESAIAAVKDPKVKSLIEGQRRREEQASEAVEWRMQEKKSKFDNLKRLHEMMPDVLNAIKEQRKSIDQGQGGLEGIFAILTGKWGYNNEDECRGHRGRSFKMSRRWALNVSGRIRANETPFLVYVLRHNNDGQTLETQGNKYYNILNFKISLNIESLNGKIRPNTGTENFVSYLDGCEENPNMQVTIKKSSKGDPGAIHFVPPTEFRFHEDFDLETFTNPKVLSGIGMDVEDPPPAMYPTSSSED